MTFHHHRLTFSKALLYASLNLIMMVGGWMLAIWITLFTPLNFSEATNSVIWPWEANVVFVGVTLAVFVLEVIWSQFQSLAHETSFGRQFRLLMAGCFFAAIALVFGFFDILLWQVCIFPLATFMLGMILIILPGKLRMNAHSQLNVTANLVELYRKRSLMFLWLRYNIEARYAQTFLGILWIVLLPLSTSLVLAFAFGELLGADRLASGISWVSFLLTGIAFFGIFRDLVLKANTSIISAMSLIGRVNFPKEILILLLVGEVLIDFFFVLIAVILINMNEGIYPNQHYIYLPIPILILVCLSTGTAFIVSWVGLFIRDLQQLITVLIQLMFYIAVLYSPQRVSSDHEALINALPVTPIITAVRDIVLWNRTPDFYQLFYPLVLGITVLYFGYVYFKINEDRFLDLA